MKKPLFLLKTLIFVFLSISLITAQDVCEALVDTVFSQIGENCAGLERNELCYGFTEIQAQFTDSATQLTAAGDRLSVEQLISVHASALSTATNEWGISIMNLRANIPDTIPDAHLALVLLGNAEIENAVPADEAYIPTDAVEVLVNIRSGGNVRTNPNTNSTIVGGAGYESTWLADALSPDREWVRIAYEGHLRWLSRIALASDSAIDNLPVIGDDLPPTYMQSFYLQSDVTQSDCEDAPANLLVLQSPENIVTQVTINGINITLSSTGVIRFVEIDGELFLEIIVLDGEFIVGSTVISVGQHSYLCLGEEENLGLDGETNDRNITCDPSPPSIVTPSAALCVLEQLPVAILNYAINVLCPGESSNNGEPVVASPTGCDDFSIITTTISNGDFRLQWTPVIGATRYEVATFDQAGIQLALIQTDSASIFTNGGVNFPPSGYVDVRAFNGDEYMCYTRLNYQRVDDAPVGGSNTSFTSANPSCPAGSMYSVTIINDIPCTITGAFAGNAFSIASGGSQAFSVAGGNQSLSVNSCPGFAGFSQSYCIEFDASITIYPVP